MVCKYLFRSIALFLLKVKCNYKMAHHVKIIGGGYWRGLLEGGLLEGGLLEGG